MKYILLLFIVAAVVLPIAWPNSVAAVALPNPIRCDTVNCLVAQVIRYILGTIALVATGMFIWGGIMMMTAAGNPERIKKAKDTLAWATVGIVVILLSWAIIRFVLGSLINTAPPQATITTQQGCCVHTGAGGAVTSCDLATTAASCSSGTFVPNNLSCSGLGCP